MESSFVFLRVNELIQNPGQPAFPIHKCWEQRHLRELAGLGLEQWFMPFDWGHHLARSDDQFDGLRTQAAQGPLTFVTNHNLAGNDHNKKASCILVWIYFKLVWLCFLLGDLLLPLDPLWFGSRDGSESRFSLINLFWFPPWRTLLKAARFFLVCYYITTSRRAWGASSAEQERGDFTVSVRAHALFFFLICWSSTSQLTAP